MNIPSTSYSRFHAIVAATPKDGFGPPVINTDYLHPSAHTIWPSGTPTGKKRKRDAGENGDSGGETRLNGATAAYSGREELLSALQERFKQGPGVEFHGFFEMKETSMTHKQRVQTLTHEIWKTTGYRFTVKDHPRINNGHKTRFLCSQDEGQKNKLKAVKNDLDPKPRLTSTGDVMAKTRYPCRSRLLISSKDSTTAGRRVITIRLAHHVAHEPYVDSSLPPEVVKTIWESFGWFNQIPVHNLTAHQTAYGQLNDTGSSEPQNGDESEDDHSSEDDEDLLPITTENTAADSTASELSNPEPPSATTTSSGPLPPPPLIPQSEVLVDIYQQRMRCHIANIRDFCDGLEYQLQFNDTRMLQVVEREGRSFLKLVEECLRKEGRLASVPAPNTSIHNNTLDPPPDPSGSSQKIGTMDQPSVTCTTNGYHNV
ncbi:hypothetical protein FA15DRAFT_585584 [Coprinopsis marcescibilis]|uniref:Uncharacterized protein n=1 Tax=Coprinopsis marcescibilis TaxID=230819 RepID=A0A5C3L4X2_COPMA|nr:hypothetical protein FA15DRAFT_585584 [Coprinopsis marcescibilis]